MRFYTVLLAVLAIATQSPVAFSEPPALTLAGVYEKGVQLEDYWVSEKLDGVRAYWDEIGRAHV